MTLLEIKEAVDNGKTVCWANELYEVVKGHGGYSIVCVQNNSCIGLTWRDGVTLNGREHEFFIKEV